MEYGPASRTRSAGEKKSNRTVSNTTPLLGHQGSEYEYNLDTSNLDGFKTPSRQVKKKKRRSKINNESKGEITPNKDIRNFFTSDSESEKANEATLPNSVTNSQGGIKLNSQSNYKAPARLNEHATNCEIQSTHEPIDLNHGDRDHTQSRRRCKQTTADSERSESAKVTQLTPENMMCVSANALMEYTKKIKNIKGKQGRSLTQRSERAQRIEQVNREILQQTQSLEESIRENDAVSQQESSSTRTGTSTMDVKLVLQMFKEIKESISSKTIPEGPQRVTDLENEQDQLIDSMYENQLNIEELKMQNRVLKGTVIRLNDQMSEMDRRIEMLELNGMKKSMVLTGLICRSRKKKESMKDVPDFLEQELGVTVDIEDIFFMNPQNTSPLVFTVSSLEQKFAILANVKNLKDLVNENEQPYFIGDHLPPRMNENKRRERDIDRQNILADVNDQVDMKYEAGKLVIEQEIYQKRVEEPNANQILKLSMEDITKLLDRKMHEGEKVENAGNQFYGYVSDARSHQEIQDLYLSLRLQHPQARHIVCSYLLPGNSPWNCQDFCNDGEQNAGRTLLTWMQNLKMESKVVFVVRYANRKKIGSSRFHSYMEAASKAALKEAHMNPRRIEEIESSIGTGLGARPKTQYQQRSLRPLSQGQRRRSYRQRGTYRGGRRTFGKNYHRNEDRRERQISNDPMYEFNEPINVNQDEWPSLRGAHESQYRRR